MLPGRRQISGQRRRRSPCCWKQPARRSKNRIRKSARTHGFGFSDFFDAVKAAALANLDAWVPAFLPKAEFQPNTGGWRVSSTDLGRDLQEDLSIHPTGIKDFGVHDMGDSHQ